MKIKVLFLCIFALAGCASNASSPKNPVVHQLDDTIAYLFESQEDFCSSQMREISGLEQSACNNAAVAAQNKCRNIVGAGFGQTISGDEVSLLMMRVVICNSKVLSGLPYSNEQTDTATLQLLNAK